MAVETEVLASSPIVLDEKPPAASLPISTTDPAQPSPKADTDVANGAQKTQFSSPSPSSTIPTAPELTSEQETKYNSLFEIVSSWPRETPASTDNSDVTSTASSKPDSSPPEPLTDQEIIWLSRESLLRYLRASSWDLAVAVKRLKSTLAWRRSYGVWDKLTPEYVSPESETGKQWILGYDNGGRPCLYLNPNRQNTPRSDRQIEHLVFMMERCLDIAPAGQETLALLINFADTKSGQGASLAQGRQTLNILQNHYPERLGRALLANLPWHISTFMRLTLPFVDPVTRAKVVFNQPMREHVPPEQLRVSHGGDLEFEYEHDIYWPALNELAAQRRKDMYERWVKGGKKIGESEVYMRGGDVNGNAGQDQQAKENGKAESGVRDIIAPAVQRDGETFEDAHEDAVKTD